MGVFVPDAGHGDPYFKAVTAWRLCFCSMIQEPALCSGRAARCWLFERLHNSALNEGFEDFGLGRGAQRAYAYAP